MILKRLLKINGTVVPIESDHEKYSDFDPELYLRQNPDVAKAKIDPLLHYIKYGQAEGRPFPERSRYKKEGPDYERIASSGYFDPEWYLDQNVDVRGSNMSPLEHFLQFGVWEGRDPGPLFSTTWYWAQYPDIVGTNPLLHYIDHGVREGRVPAPPKNGLKAASEVYASIRDLDPELNADERFSFFKGVRFIDGRQRINRLKPVLSALLEYTPSQCTHFILVPWLVYGGADLVTANVCRAAEKVIGVDRLAVLVVDYDRTDSISWLPENVTVINFAKLAERLSSQEKLDLLEKYVQVVRPQKILNNNSNLVWDLFRERGGVMRQQSKLYACIFCRDFNSQGSAAGYADTHLRDSIASLQSIYLDNASFAREIADQFGILNKDREKFVVMKQPVKFGLTNRRAKHPSAGPGLRILWASRLVKQKNYRLLAEIINGSPKDFSFTVWGEGAPEVMEEFRALLTEPAAVEIKGRYASYEALPLEDYDAYLYTSLWDGIPNAILEAAAFGFPLVCSNVGGVAEVVDEQRGWRIDEPKEASAYISALREIAADKDKAWIRGGNLQDFVKKSHSLEALRSALSSQGQFVESFDDV